MSDEPPNREENERQYKVIDQMLSMHSALRDRMDRRAFWLNTILVASSLFLTVFAFVDDDVLRALGVDPGITRFTFGWVAVVILICSITEFRVDWRTVAGRHGDAAIKLMTLKARYRRTFSDAGGSDPRTYRRFTAEYERTMSALPPLPERWFNRLKAEHQFKRLLSERISSYPAAPAWFLKLQLRGEGLLEACRRRRERT